MDDILLDHVYLFGYYIGSRSLLVVTNSICAQFTVPKLPLSFCSKAFLDLYRDDDPDTAVSRLRRAVLDMKSIEDGKRQAQLGRRIEA